MVQIPASPLQQARQAMEHGFWQSALDALAHEPDTDQSVYLKSRAYWQLARDALPDPLQPRPGAVASYIRALQIAAHAIQQLSTFALDAPDTLADIPGDLLKQRQAAIRQAIKDQIRYAQARIYSQRSATLAMFNSMFRLGRPPEPPLDGRYKGLYVATALAPGLTEYGNFMRRIWMPWKGKIFYPAEKSGENVFDRSMLPVSRLFWPSYRLYKPDSPHTFRAFSFRSWTGPGIADADRMVLKIDYALAENPQFIIRNVLDELVQLVEGFYFGKAHLRFGDGWHLAAYFALEKTPAHK